MILRQFIYANPLVALRRTLIRKTNINLAKYLHDNGFVVSAKTLGKWINEGIIVIEYSLFIKLVNACRIPVIYFIDEEMSLLCNEKCVIPKDEWFEVSLRLSEFLDNKLIECGGIERASRHLGMEQTTFNAMRNNIDSKIYMSRILEWFVMDNVNRDDYLYDRNPYYTGNKTIDLKRYDELMSFMVADEIHGYKTTEHQKIVLFNSRRKIENNYQLPKSSKDSPLQNEKLAFRQSIINEIDRLMEENPEWKLIDIICNLYFYFVKLFKTLPHS